MLTMTCKTVMSIRRVKYMGGEDNDDNTRVIVILI